jgi:hypothetical protein
MTHHTNSIRIWDLQDLRRHLAKLELDWDAPPFPPAYDEPASGSAPGTLQLELPGWIAAIQEAESLTKAGSYAQAANAYGTVIDAGAATPEIWYRQAMLFLASGQKDDYRRACKAMVERFGEDVPPLVANNMAWTLVLGPNAVKDSDAAVRLARSAVAAFPSPNRLNTLGGTLLRAGRGPEVLQTLLHGIETGGQSGTPFDWVLLSLALAQEGRGDDARRWLNRLAAWETSAPPQAVGEATHWDQKLQLQMLRAEVESQLSGRKL